MPFQSTLPMRGATVSKIAGIRRLEISIHTPHAGSDESRWRQWLGWYDFNPHSPCGERPFSISAMALSFSISIHTPHAGSDVSFVRFASVVVNFNPHSPCGERRYSLKNFKNSSFISIHTPHAGSDQFPVLWCQHPQ